MIYFINRNNNSALICLSIGKYHNQSDFYNQAIDTVVVKYLNISILLFGNNNDNNNGESIISNVISDYQGIDNVNFIIDNQLNKDSKLLLLRKLSLCPNIIISLSGLSWWAAFLSGHNNIIAPKYPFRDNLNSISNDYYLPSWIVI